MQRPQMEFLHKLLGVATLLGEPELVKFLIKGLSVNPFKVSMEAMTAFHIACGRSAINMIDFLTFFDFHYVNAGSKAFDLKRQVAKVNKVNKNSGSHYAALKDVARNYKTVKRLNEDMLGQFNGRNWFPFECSRNKEIADSAVEFRKSQLWNTLLEHKGPLLSDKGRVREGFGKLETAFVYAIVCRDTNKAPEKTLVFEQLNRINRLHKDEETNMREQMLRGLQDQILRRGETGQEVYEDKIVIQGGGDDEDYDEEQENEEMKGGEVYTFGNQSKLGRLQESPLDDSELKSLVGPKEHKWKVFDGDVMQVKWIQLLDHESPGREYFRHCFLIGLKEAVMPKMAEFLNLEIFNKIKGFPEPFRVAKQHEFENFRDSHKQKMTLFVLGHELDLEHFRRRGIVEQYFPFHDFRRMSYINSSWGKERYMALVDNLLPTQTDLARLTPFNALNYYHGSEVALYMGFNSVYTSWLLVMAVFGVLTVGAQYSLGLKYDNKFLPIYAAVVSVIITLAQQFWERRQNEFSFLWNTIDFKNNEQPRREFQGHFAVHPLERKIVVENHWPSQSRRYLTDSLMCVLGVGLIIANFISFFYINRIISSKLRDGELTKTEASYLSLLSGAGNGSVVFVLDKVFRYLTDVVIDWENHEFESDRIMSKVPKLFFFNFAMNYINLFFYAFYLQDFVVLQSNFISMFITKNLLHLGLMNLMPWGLYKAKDFMLKRRFRAERARRKGAFLRNLQMKAGGAPQFETLSKALREETLRMEAELLLWEMAEVSIIQPLPPAMEDVWLNYMLQFGFIAFFGITFPLAPLIGVIFNVIDMNFVFYSYSRVFKREKIIELDSIGVWNHIIQAMTIASLIVNIALFAWTCEGFEKLTGRSIGGYDLLLELVIYEHIVFVIKFLLSVAIKAKPAWLVERLRFRRIKERMYKESSSKKQVLTSHLQSVVGDKGGSGMAQRIARLKNNDFMNLFAATQQSRRDSRVSAPSLEDRRIFATDSEQSESGGEEAPRILDLEEEETQEDRFLEYKRSDSLNYQKKIEKLDFDKILKKKLTPMVDPRQIVKDDLSENLLGDEEQNN